jgi:hypothetical protein
MSLKVGSVLPKKGAEHRAIYEEILDAVYVACLHMHQSRVNCTDINDA